MLKNTKESSVFVLGFAPEEYSFFESRTLGIIIAIVIS